jgi:GTPase involved in cell partitioning and DNA repair
MFNAIEGMGIGYNYQASNKSEITDTLNKLFQLLKSLVDAKAEITKKVLDELAKAEREMRKFDKQLAKKKAPQIKQKISQLATKFKSLLQELKASGKMNGIQGGELQRKLASISTRLEELRRKQMAVENLSEQSNLVSDQGVDSSLII